MSRVGYPDWWEDTVTIYNKYTDPQTSVVHWFKHTVTDCFWQLVGSTVKVGDTVLDGKAVTCRIPQDARYREKKDWVRLPNDQMSEYFTLGAEDILVRGDCDFEIDEYTKGHRSSDLLNKYRSFQDCFEVSEHSNNTGRLRNSPHYLARGK